MLQAKGDLLAFLVDIQNDHFDLVVDLQHVAWVVDPAPGHIGDVQKAIDTTQVDERAEVGNVLDGTCAELIDLDFREKPFLLIFAGHLDQLPTADHDVATAFVDLQDHTLDHLANEILNIWRTADVDLAGRQEHVYADIDQQTTLDLTVDDTFHHIAFMMLGDDIFPGSHTQGFAAGETDFAGLVFHVLKQDFHFVAWLGWLFVFPLVERNQTFSLKADVHDHAVAIDFNHSASDNRANVKARAAKLQLVHARGI